MRGLGQDYAVDGFVRRVEHAHRKTVRRARPGCIRYVQHERRLAAFVPARIDVVQPHVREVVYRPETEQVAALRV